MRRYSQRERRTLDGVTTVDFSVLFIIVTFDGIAGVPSSQTSANDYCNEDCIRNGMYVFFRHRCVMNTRASAILARIERCLDVPMCIGYGLCGNYMSLQLSVVACLALVELTGGAIGLDFCDA